MVPSNPSAERRGTGVCPQCLLSVFYESGAPGDLGLQGLVSLWDAHSLVGETQMQIIARQWMLLLSGCRQKDTGGKRGAWNFPAGAHTWEEFQVQGLNFCGRK